LHVSHSHFIDRSTLPAKFASRIHASVASAVVSIWSASPPEPMTLVVAPSTMPVSVCLPASLVMNDLAASASPASDMMFAPKATA
jgi:hypothetical protein